ncbi:MAG: mu-protocadherin- cell-suface protein, partial [Planctomycetia bacterium]|nr:mu-protocadherin- cell-suface protein [Planctomycetia bacterium]
WAGLTTWFSWNAASNAAWQQPIYYDYGTGGNVYISNNYAMVGGQQVATRDEFAESAAVLATVPPPANEEQAAAVEWMPLGTFALSTSEKDTEPTRVLQLAVTKDGIIGGTWYNYQTEQSVSIQGKVDKDTQRVAFRIGENDNLIAETGMYNLTKDEVPLMVHFGTQKTEQFMMVRLKYNEEDDKEAQKEEIKLP